MSRAAATVVWFTGLPSSGKTTLARAVQERLAMAGRAAVLLDGDEVRAAIQPPHGFDERGRADFYATLAGLAGLIARQGHVVLVAATASRRAFRDQAREFSSRFIEVYLAAPLAECVARDPKGLYARSRDGGAPELPGVGASYEPPVSPEVTADGGEDAAALARIVERIMHEPPRPRGA